MLCNCWYPGECSLLPERAATDPRDCTFEFDLCGWQSMNPGSGRTQDLRPQVTRYLQCD